MPRAVLLSIAACAATLLLAGCGGGGTSATGGCTQTQGGGTDVVFRPGETLALLTDVAALRQPCSDEVTFTFRGDSTSPPGFRAQYLPAARALVEDGSGRPISVAGSAYLVVRIEPAATADLSGGDIHFTYKGPRRIEVKDTRYVREVVKSGDFESVVTWVIGLDEKRPFTARATGSPRRVVVEIGN